MPQPRLGDGHESSPIRRSLAQRPAKPSVIAGAKNRGRAPRRSGRAVGSAPAISPVQPRRWPGPVAANSGERSRARKRRAETGAGGTALRARATRGRGYPCAVQPGSSTIEVRAPEHGGDCRADRASPLSASAQVRSILVAGESVDLRRCASLRGSAAKFDRSEMAARGAVSQVRSPTGHPS